MKGADRLEGGKGDDFLNGDLQPEAGDPEVDPLPNSDTCEGGKDEDTVVNYEND